MQIKSIRNGREQILRVRNNAADINLVDQVTPTVMIPLRFNTNSTTLAVPGVRGEYTITPAVSTGFIAGATVTIADTENNRFVVLHQVGAVADGVVTLDSPLDFSYAAGAEVSAGT
jgi:hypothetical protein